MASLKDTIRYSMLEYPTLHVNPVDVCEHLFCIIGNGYEWRDGELVDKFTAPEEPPTWVQRLLNLFRYTTKGGMKYPEPNERIAKMDPEYIRYSGILLKEDAEFVRMQWTENNIDAIIEASPLAVYFGDHPNGHYFLKGICPEYAKAFTFPDDIKEDWGVALYAFLNYWLYRLNVEYGVTQNKDEHLTWEKDIQDGRTAIIEARNRLHPLINKGETYEQHVAAVKKLTAELFAKDSKSE